ncbi:MAG: hypothetical protein ACYDHN_04945 [Solirubrobacteraceae bacterium]
MSDSGALVAPADRRSALWQLGLAPAAEADSAMAGTQLALPLGLPGAPRLRKLGRWQRLIADYSTTGVTVGDHALAILRERLTVAKLATSAQLARLPSGCEVAVAGLVIARQRPGTAKGTMFLLFEDEFGTINLVVSKDVYERHRLLARAEPLLLARGRLERSSEGGKGVQALGVREQQPAAREGEGEEEIRPVINVIVRELAPLDRFLEADLEDRTSHAGASVHRLSPAQSSSAGRTAAKGEEELEGADVGSSMRAAAPPVQSFAMGRRR